MANEYMKHCSVSLTIKEMQGKMIWRLHLIPVRMAIIKKINNKTDVGEGILIFC
jgi:hypothetical protein